MNNHFGGSDLGRLWCDVLIMWALYSIGSGLLVALDLGCSMVEIMLSSRQCGPNGLLFPRQKNMDVVEIFVRVTFCRGSSL